jgi:DNA-binding CsgD family transcriptional regulator
MFRIPSLNVVKISFPRPVGQASLRDRDIHSGQQHVPLAMLPVPGPDSRRPFETAEARCSSAAGVLARAPAAYWSAPLQVIQKDRQVLTLLASGHEGSAVADVLSLSPLTVKTHIANMLTKLGVRHRGQLITFACENGIVVPGVTPVDPFVDQLAEAS